MTRPGELLAPLLSGPVSAWRGLPAMSAADLNLAFGLPMDKTVSVLGEQPAERWQFANGLVAWLRDGEAVMVESPLHPAIQLLNELPPPDAVLEHEIVRPGSYVHEHLYVEIGLVLSVADPYAEGEPKSIIRCRGIPVLRDASEFGPGYRLSFDDQVRWGIPASEVLP